MPTDAKPKLHHPPLNCEQLEDRQVLSVTASVVGTPTATILHTHPTLATATNFVIMQPVAQVVAPGSTSGMAQPGSVGSTSGTAAASSAVATGSSAPSAGTAISASSGGSASRMASGGGPLFTSGSLPVICFGSVSPQMFDASSMGNEATGNDAAGNGAAAPTPVSTAAAAGSHSGSVAVITQPDAVTQPGVTLSTSAPTTALNDVAQVAANLPVSQSEYPVISIAPTVTPAPQAAPGETALAAPVSHTLTMSTQALESLSTPTTLTSSTTSDTDRTNYDSTEETTAFVVHGGAATPFTTDDPYFNSSPENGIS